MTFELFRLLFDYYSFRDRENSFEPLRRNGSKLFCIPPYFVRHTRKPVEIRSIRVRPHNSDSEGRRFESCRAYHLNEARFPNIFIEKRVSSYLQSLERSGLLI